MILDSDLLLGATLYTRTPHEHFQTFYWNEILWCVYIARGILWNDTRVWSITTKQKYIFLYLVIHEIPTGTGVCEQHCNKLVYMPE